MSSWLIILFSLSRNGHINLWWYSQSLILIYQTSFLLVTICMLSLVPFSYFHLVCVFIFKCTSWTQQRFWSCSLVPFVLDVVYGIFYCIFIHILNLHMIKFVLFVIDEFWLTLTVVYLPSQSRYNSSITLENSPEVSHCGQHYPPSTASSKQWCFLSL